MPDHYKELQRSQAENRAYSGSCSVLTHWVRTLQDPGSSELEEFESALVIVCGDAITTGGKIAVLDSVDITGEHLRV